MHNILSDLSDTTVEEKRLKDNNESNNFKWYRWGPYLSERSWATVREDYSHDGDAWNNFPFEHANARVFRWGEDGIFGVSDLKQLICMNVALWNGKDERLKERMFGLTGHQGNHGEDCKEIYYYLDNTPSHSYMKALYKYPFVNPYPYEQLKKENSKRGFDDKEFEIDDIDGIFKDSKNNNDNCYFDVFFEMAKDGENSDDLNFRITAYNRSETQSGELYIIPQIFFRNTWSWGDEETKLESKNDLLIKKDSNASNLININCKRYGNRTAIFQPSPGNFLSSENSSTNLFGKLNENSTINNKVDDDIEPNLLFTDNESNLVKLFNKKKNPTKYCKDGFEEYIVNNNKKAVNPKKEGTKSCAVYHFPSIPPGEYVTVRYKFTNDCDGKLFKADHLSVMDEDVFDSIFDDRAEEADNFYWRINPMPINDELRKIQRQAFAGLLWTKQFYHFIWENWYNGDPNIRPAPPQNRANGRNKDWKHMYIHDILSMPDKWEYPFFASWDTAFHCIPLAMIDPQFAKHQLDLLTREWYMHPNGQIPAYEWNFCDVNPPVHAWAVYRTFKIERNMYGREDRVFLERVFQKLLLNFTWWVNRKDAEGKNLFEGGFLGLDNIGIFNRSEPLPTGGVLEQADSTGWMAFFSLQMLNIALELAKENSVYEDVASKFFQHFILISDSMSFEYVVDNTTEKTKEIVKQNLWNEEDQFYYDAISWGGSHRKQIPIRSLVGLIPLYASMTLEPHLLEKFPYFKNRIEWYIENKPNLFDRNIASMSKRGVGERLLLSLVTKDRLQAILTRMLDEDEFLSQYGIRSLSKYHEEHPFEMNVNDNIYSVKYLPGESNSGMFGGNSNWRGPIWFPTTFLIIEALQRFFLYYGTDFKVECPVGSGTYLNLAEVAEELAYRMISMFVPDAKGQRPIFTGDDAEMLSSDPFFKDHIPFFEYFDGDTGRGLGASHQCGWTSLVAKFINDIALAQLKQSGNKSRSGSIYTNHSATTEDELERPRWKGARRRRKSAKSLVHFTATVLDLTEEERHLHTIGGTHTGMTPRSSIAEGILGKEYDQILTGEESLNSDLKYILETDDDPQSAHIHEQELIGKLKKQIQNMTFKDMTNKYGGDEWEEQNELYCD